MPTSIQDVRLTIRNLLRSNWNNSTLPVDLSADDIHTGWYDDGKGFPQVSVTDTDEGSVGGGRTGYSSIDGGGAGGVQLRSGTALVTAWAGSRDDYDARGADELQADEMATVIEEIIGSNQSPGELDALSIDRRRKLVDSDSNPVEHYVQFDVRFVWRKTPT
jgi:hypothetical protein